MRPRNALPQGHIYYFKRERKNKMENITWILGKARTANHTYARAPEVKDTEVKTIRTLQLVWKNLFIFSEPQRWQTDVSPPLCHMARRKLIWEEVVFRKTSVQSLTYMESILHDRSGSNTKGYTQSKIILMSPALEISMCSSVREKQTFTTCSRNSVRKGTQYGPEVVKIIHIFMDIESKMQLKWKFTKN